ncbi:MAG: hypothetical protein JWP97_5540 [Labilithrix sp.]|nr:hypothetical protein [Labilithrix sp.]
MARRGVGRYGSGMTRPWRSRKTSLSRALLGILVALAVPALVAACQEDDPRPAVASDGRPNLVAPGGDTDAAALPSRDGSTGIPKDAGDGSVCSALTMTGFLLDREAVVGEPPTATGGTITDGDYNLVSYVVYVGDTGTAGPTGITARSSIRITGDVIEQILETGGNSPSTTVTTRSTFSAVTTTFAETQICPTPGAGGTRQFNASDAQLTLTNLITKEAFTYAKR